MVNIVQEWDIIESVKHTLNDFCISLESLSVFKIGLPRGTLAWSIIVIFSGYTHLLNIR